MKYFRMKRKTTMPTMNMATLNITCLPEVTMG